MLLVLLHVALAQDVHTTHGAAASASGAPAAALVAMLSVLLIFLRRTPSHR